MTDKDKEYYHNKGQQDAPDGKYEKPYDSIPYHLSGNSESEVEAQEAYDAGWSNAQSQK